MTQVYFYNGEFTVGAGLSGLRLKTKFNDDGGLSIKAGKGGSDLFMLLTGCGDFLEVLDNKGAVKSLVGDGGWETIKVGASGVTLRPKKLPDLGLSKAQILSKTETVTRYLVSDKPYNVGLPETLPKLIKWLEKKLSQIPEKSRKTASVSFDTTVEYGETYPQFEISYQESETYKEIVRRLQIEAQRLEITKAAQIKQFNRLKAELEAA